MASLNIYNNCDYTGTKSNSPVVNSLGFTIKIFQNTFFEETAWQDLSKEEAEERKKFLLSEIIAINDEPFQYSFSTGWDGGPGLKAAETINGFVKSDVLKMMGGNKFIQLPANDQWSQKMAEEASPLALDLKFKIYSGVKNSSNISDLRDVIKFLLYTTMPPFHYNLTNMYKKLKGVFENLEEGVVSSDRGKKALENAYSKSNFDGGDSTSIKTKMQKMQKDFLDVFMDNKGDFTKIDLNAFSEKWTIELMKVFKAGWTKSWGPATVRVEAHPLYSQPEIKIRIPPDFFKTVIDNYTSSVRNASQVFESYGLSLYIAMKDTASLDADKYHQNAGEKAVAGTYYEKAAKNLKTAYGSNLECLKQLFLDCHLSVMNKAMGTDYWENAFKDALVRGEGTLNYGGIMATVEKAFKKATEIVGAGSDWKENARGQFTVNLKTPDFKGDFWESIDWYVESFSIKPSTQIDMLTKYPIYTEFSVSLKTVMALSNVSIFKLFNG